MNFQKILVAVCGVLLIGAAWRSYGLAGVALVIGGILMWVLLHVNRVVTTLKRAADRPVGYLDSAVMFNAKLKPGVSLLHVLAMTRALGQPQSPEGVQPESFRWTDAAGSSVTCEFAEGKLVKWELERPVEADPGEPGAAP
ncbi:MAG: hypothetical protein NVS3B2_10150 [Ramlibacter sp.]